PGSQTRKGKGRSRKCQKQVPKGSRKRDGDEELDKGDARPGKLQRCNNKKCGRAKPACGRKPTFAGHTGGSRGKAGPCGACKSTRAGRAARGGYASRRGRISP